MVFEKYYPALGFIFWLIGKYFTVAT